MSRGEVKNPQTDGRVKNKSQYQSQNKQRSSGRSSSKTSQRNKRS